MGWEWEKKSFQATFEWKAFLLLFYSPTQPSLYAVFPLECINLCFQFSCGLQSLYHRHIPAHFSFLWGFGNISVRMLAFHQRKAVSRSTRGAIRDLWETLTNILNRGWSLKLLFTWTTFPRTRMAFSDPPKQDGIDNISNCFPDHRWEHHDLTSQEVD